jgi:acylphosphatase
MSNNLDQDRVRWPGSGSIVDSNSVPFGYYLSETCSADETTFENDCSSSAMWAAKRLGYPIVDIEMIDANFYACFEESVMEYNRVLNEFNIVNNLTNLQGLPSDTYKNVQGMVVKGTGLPYVIQLSKQYGAEALVGGEVEVKRNYITLTGSAMVTSNNQVYDLNKLLGENVEQLSGSRIEVKRIFHYRSAAIARIYDPFSMTGMSYSNVLQELGFSAYSPATQFLMTPIFEDLERVQAIEFNDMVRKSAYSFEILGNNKLRIFPIPTETLKLYIEYIVESDRDITNFYSGSNYEYISDPSDMPYEEVTYCKVNQAGKQWIKKYFLALCKETLGRILQKYTTVPIPGGEVTMDGAELRSEAKDEMSTLIEKLREMFEKSLRVNQLENKEKESDMTQKMLNRVPIKLYIG